MMHWFPIEYIKGLKLFIVTLLEQIDSEEFYNLCDKHSVWENEIFTQWTHFHMLKNDISHTNLPLHQNAVNQKRLQEWNFIMMPTFGDKYVRNHVL